MGRVRLLWAIFGMLLVVAVIWGALFIAYDYRSPVNQFFRGYGTVSVDGWNINDLDALCIRLEPPDGTPVTSAAVAIGVAQNANPGGYAREVLLVSAHDVCGGATPHLAWVVPMAWPIPSRATLAPGSRPRAIVLVDAKTGVLLLSHRDDKG